MIFDYHWQDNFSTYLKRSTGYKAGGVNVRSDSFLAYDKEKVKTWEIGVKSEWWDQRIRVNAAAFRGDYDDIQIDVADPAQPTIAETANASETVEVDGFELDFELLPFEGLIPGLNYTYLDGNMPPQPNPLAGGAEERFVTSQTPQHAGSLTVDYTLSPSEIGTLSAHLDITSTDRYSYVVFAPDLQRYDAYTLLNTRVTLSDIPVGHNNNVLSLSVWGRNLTDEEYVVFSFPNVQAFGTPRTAGIDITYQF